MNSDISLVQWDTDKFGIKIGNLILEEPITQEKIKIARQEAALLDYDLLYMKEVFIPNNLLSEELILADEKVIYIKKSNGGTMCSPRVVSLLHTPLTDELLNLSLESGKYSRYKLDKKLPESCFTTLYHAWIVNSLTGAIADDVLAVKDGDRVKGILTYKKKGKVYEIGIIAVSPENTGKGIGSLLMQSFLSKVPVGCTVEVATQKRNRVACNYYEKNGFMVDKISNIYHLWIK